MDIKQLRYFLTIADLQSFSRAAASLRIAQPALTRQIQHLETELGVQLLLRHARGVYPNEAGRLLQDRARQVLELLDRTRRDVASTAVEVIGNIHLGMPPALRHLVTGPLLSKFAKEFPSVLVRLTEATSTNLSDAIRSGALDVAIVASLESGLVVDALPLVQECLVVVGPCNDRIVGSVAELDDLSDLPLILTSRPNTLRLIVEQAMAKRGMTPNVVVEADCFSTVSELIDAGVGYSIVPSSACVPLTRFSGIRAVPLRNVSVTWTLTQARDRAVPIAVAKIKSALRATISAALTAKRWPHAHAWSAVDDECILSIPSDDLKPFDRVDGPFERAGELDCSVDRPQATFASPSASRLLS